MHSEHWHDIEMPCRGFSPSLYGLEFYVLQVNHQVEGLTRSKSTASPRKIQTVRTKLGAGQCDCHRDFKFAAVIGHVQRLAGVYIPLPRVNVPIPNGCRRIAVFVGTAIVHAHYEHSSQDFQLGESDGSIRLLVLATSRFHRWRKLCQEQVDRQLMKSPQKFTEWHMHLCSGDVGTVERVELDAGLVRLHKKKTRLV